MIDVCLLGCGGMMPLHNRFLSSALFRCNGSLILIDCGEGTQIPFRLADFGVRALDAICFTHYHADHIAGLPGLLLTLGNAGRVEPLVLIGPKGIENVVKSLTVIAQNLPFELVFVTTTSDNFPYRLGEIYINYCEMNHNVACVSYSIEIRRPGKFDVEKTKNNNVPLKLWNTLQKGNTVEYEGRVFTPQMVLGQERKGLKIAYCTDSRPTSKIVELARDSDLFICEGMYGEEEFIKKALDKKHMLFSEAAQIAKDANVTELWLTHYSPSMNAPEYFIGNAKKIFNNTFAGHDLKKTTLYFFEEETSD